MGTQPADPLSDVSRLDPAEYEDSQTSAEDHTLTDEQKLERRRHRLEPTQTWQFGHCMINWLYSLIFLSRNRAAAAKCRQRRRALLDALAQAGAQQAAENQRIARKVARLQEDICRLEKSLLAHDCHFSTAL